MPVCRVDGPLALHYDYAVRSTRIVVTERFSLMLLKGPDGLAIIFLSGAEY
jgi:hypothetical protein